MINQLIEVIRQKVNIRPEDVDLCGQYFETFTVSKNTIVDEQEKIPQYLYFIGSGYMRLFYYNDEGDEVTSHLSAPGSFITSFLSFINQKKAKENIECITDCELLRISPSNLMALIDTSENFKQFSLIIFEQAISVAERRANELATLQADQRYKKLLETQPEILQNVPIQYIASYLGIKPQSLSRIRRQFLK